LADALALWCWSRRKALAATVQEFVTGTPVNIMVACWQGEVLGELSVRAVACPGLTGAALVVELIDNPEFSRRRAAGGTPGCVRLRWP
jgi:hypothetical protein